uniref:alpha-N-acetylgalactosaminide alpha-2,6-sialyltransferase n=1 Tax=Sinocyclocheilus grahami TaxID=75366 RepID=A0A672K3C1_SINGR
MIFLRIFLAIYFITLPLLIFVTFYNGNCTMFEEPDSTNSSAVTDSGAANTTMSSDRLGTPLTLVAPMNKHNFTALPQWKFDDIYRLDPQFKRSECMVSFDHVNMSEWNRLYHLNNPFGYMGFNYTAIKAAVDTIPKLASTQLLQVPTRAKDGCIPCAVVGTCGILNGSRLGKEIDSSDYVFSQSLSFIMFQVAPFIHTNY